MKFRILFFILFLVTLVGCEEDATSLTGVAIITFENTKNYDIDIAAGLYFEEGDSQPFDPLSSQAIFTSSFAEVEVESLLPGNYYLKYQFKDRDEDTWSSTRVIPFQIIGGKENEIDVDI